MCAKLAIKPQKYKIAAQNRHTNNRRGKIRIFAASIQFDSMKRLFLFAWTFISAIMAFSTPIIFNGEPLTSHIGQTVQFNQTLYVCGHYNHTLYLSYERVRSADELAVWGTSAYDSARVRSNNALLTAYCPNINADTIRLGATLTNLEATVTGERSIRVNGNVIVNNNIRPTSIPNVGDAELIVCAANLEYYCPVWANTYGASSDEEFAIQHIKTIKALTNISADIYALTELQQGVVSLDSLINGLNASTAPGRYNYVIDNDLATTTYTKVGFIYRTDKVRPLLTLGHPYGPGSSSWQMQSGYHKREYVQCFEELSSGERFVLSMNHFKSKSGGDSTNNFYNATRVENAEHLIDFLNQELQNRYYEDDDVLVVGDLNCSTMEEPILRFEADGYLNMLTQYAPSEYSYTYNNQVQYLDHVLASPSMAAQITGAQPYHINADESYKFYYTYGDTSMYRYSDHDPIIIGITLSSTFDNECYNIDFQESFENNLGCFSSQNVSGNDYWYTYSNYSCACANGYNSGANEDWLISPTINSRTHENIVFGFDQLFGYGVQNNWGHHCKLMVSDDYHGDATAATWQEITALNMPNAPWTWVTNNISLPNAYKGKEQIVFAFKYIVSSDDIPAWEIKNIHISGTCVIDSTGIEHIADTDNYWLYSSNKAIYCISGHPTDITVYDLTGRVIMTKRSTQEISVPVSAGVYLVRIGKQTAKIVVR